MGSPNPVAFQIFNIDIMWYGIIIAAGITAAVIITCKRAPRHRISSEKILDILIISIPAGIIGARLYYVLFNWDLYSGSLLAMINIRMGGLAIHGGLIAGMLTAVLLCRKWKISPANFLDLCVPSIALAQSIGRWGNYFNSEAHGGVTDLPWAITVNGQSVHPTFLYESIWCLLLFLLLVFIDNRRQFTGQILLLYGLLYSIERFFVEALRTDSLMLGPFKQAQVLSLTVIIICLITYIILYRKSKKR